MKTRLSVTFQTNTFQTILTFLIIASIVWVARYWRLSEFGLYEDDWTFIPRVIEMSFSQLMEFISNYISQFRGQGRPLHHSLIRFFSFIGWGIGGLRGIYLLGYLIITLNAFFFYLLLKRMFNHSFGFVGALAYCLYSADTTQAFLTHSLGLHPSLTLFLLAMHAYLSRKYVTSYLLIFISLLAYETPYFLFLTAPLFKNEWDKGLIKKLVLHAAILGVFFLSIYVLRASIGEFRVANLGFSETVSESFRRMVQGPIYNLRSYYFNALQAYGTLDEGIIGFVLLPFPILFSLLFYWAIDRSGISDGHSNLARCLTSMSAREKIFRQFITIIRSAQFVKISKLLLIAVLMLVLSYPLTLTTEPNIMYGRSTRNHFAGIVGNAMLFASLWVILVQIRGNRWIRIASALVFAAIFSVMVGFGQVIQRDYANAWKYQQKFWTEVLDLIPDAQENTAIIVDPNGMKESIHILANTWNMPRVLDRIFEFPEEWEFSPSAYKMYSGWFEFLHDGNGKLRLDWPLAITSAEYIREVNSDEMILIFTVDGKLSRQFSPIVIGGISYPLKSPSYPILQTFRHRAFYDVLILNSDE